MTSPSKSLSAAIRVAKPADIPPLSELNAGLFAEDAGTRDPFVAAEWPGRDTYVAELVADGRRNVAFVADVDGAAVGYLVGRLQDAGDFRPVVTAVLESMYVRPDRRDAGVGTALVHTFLAWANESGAGRVSVNAYCANTGAIRFYERFGLRSKTVTLDMAM
ncbi:GNAT family N-acetyltransferase [Actinopolymorpha rutila]|uniref:GNAT superfamily N-acetyltransferase n=1 Tax=Actinopolymorpha rutila TaxID=446787 RepID=A0A852ZXI5_9ACTN|nr:GNAT family N-acetyltransferase [Actinopolymorpha rutila]NYH93436.1 GNAT superfamily N-acetyltransferase [Actinopolymorpha rutila]